MTPANALLYNETSSKLTSRYAAKTTNSTQREATVNEKTGSTADSLAKGRSTGYFRCLNCFARVSPLPNAKTYKCPHCNFEWRVSWISTDMPRIRGPVWNVNRRLAEDEMRKKRKAEGNRHGSE